MSSDRYGWLPRSAKNLSAKAWHRLEYSMSVEPLLVDERQLPFGLPRIRVWGDAWGFCNINPRSLTVFYPFDEAAAPILRMAEWKRSHDFQVLNASINEENGEEPEPTIEVHDVSIDREGLEKILEKGMPLRIPIVWQWEGDWSATEDTGLAGFEVFDPTQPQARLRLAWFDDFPPEWQPVVDWFYELLHWLDGCLKEG